MSEIRSLIVRIATENHGWGYTRIQGALANLNHEVSRGTLATSLRKPGMAPAPDRLRKTTWTESLFDPRSGSAVYAGLPRDARRRRGASRPSAAPVTESQRLRGAICPHHQGVMSGPDYPRR